jgi:hypothetical protein
MTGVVLDGRKLFASAQYTAKSEATLGVLAALHEPCLCSDDCPFCMSCGHGDEFWPCSERMLIDECLGEQRVSEVLKAMRARHDDARIYTLKELL